MKKTALRISLVCLALLLTLSLVACGEKENDYKHFTANETLTTISDGTNTYSLRTLPQGFRIGVPMGETPVCCYKNPAATSDCHALYLYAHGEDSGILYTAMTYFATDEAEAKLQTFFAGEYRFFALAHSSVIFDERVLIAAPQKNLIVENYEASTDTLEMDVTTIEQDHWFPLIAKDDTLLFSTQIGALLTVGEDWYYVDFATLDNSHFNADGYFSFRSGTVTFKKLSGDAVTVVAAAAARTDDDISPVLHEGMTPEDLQENNVLNSVISLTAFWVLFVLVGFVLPLSGFVTCLLLALRKKAHARRWFVPFGIASAWLILSIVILILLLV